MKNLSAGPRYTVFLLSSIIALGCMAGCTGSVANDATASATKTTPSSDPNYLATVKIGSTAGRAISPTFMGLSHEWGVQTQMGSEATGVDYIYRQLLKNLMAYGSGPLIIRIGGNSTDTSGAPTATTAVPFAELAKALGVHFYLGVNLGAGNVDLAMVQARAYVSQMPGEYLDAIEIGNEPDNYVSSGMRLAPYTFQSYLAEFNTWRDHISPILSTHTQFVGASWGRAYMLTNAQSFNTSESSALTSFSYHHYVADANAVHPDDFLLESNSATEGPNSVVTAVSETHNFNTPFRMGELNSLYNGGLKGVSNTFQSTLWAIDTMFEYANSGVDGVNWHGNLDPSAYNAIVIATKTTGSMTSYSLTAVRPLYYGLLFFQKATGNQAHLLPVALETSANLKSWATVDAFGVPRLIIINKDKISSGTVSVSMPNYKHAQLLTLAAPSYLSTNNITFAGQTFDGSQDGTIQGEQSIETFSSTDGIFKIPMATTSAALVIFSK